LSIIKTGELANLNREQCHIGIPVSKRAGYFPAMLSFLAFAFSVPVVPLTHSCPANGCDNLPPLAFHGSLSWAAFQIGVVIDGIGRVGSMYVGGNLMLLVFIAILLVMWAFRKHIVRKEESPLQ
jgi:hypothetical protein